MNIFSVLDKKKIKWKRARDKNFERISEKVFEGDENKKTFDLFLRDVTRAMKKNIAGAMFVIY